MVLARVFFWVALGIVAYTHVGYALIIALLARWRARPVLKGDITPTVTMLVAAYNEEDCIASKIENTLALDYPADKLELAIVTDGSTDRTPEIVASYAERGVRLFHQPERRGKAAALARAFPLTRGEVVVFSDANCFFRRDALYKLVRNLADPAVGAVGGAKRMLREGESIAGQGEGLYWRYESFLKRCDSAVSSVMGVPGEIWAARREAYRCPEADTLLDDFVASLRMVEAGWRVVFEPDALAYEKASPDLRAEWSRRVRNAAGGWQAFFKLRGMLRHKSGLVTFQYLSHRMARWMVAPVLLAPLFAANTALAFAAGPFYKLMLAGQLAFYRMAGLGWLWAWRGRQVGWFLAPFYFCMLNAAAIVGGWRFITGRQPVTWEKVR